MGENTKIEWTDSSWNPIRFRNHATGGVGHYCEKVSSGCAHCYAERMQPRFRNPIRYNAADKVLGEVFLDCSELERPLKWRTPKLVFPCSMTDLFGSWVKPEWLAAIFDVMDRTERHTYQVVTKRPENALKMWPSISYTETVADANYTRDRRVKVEHPFRESVWLLASAEDQAAYDLRRPHMEACRDLVPVIGWSLEPLLGPINLGLDAENKPGWVIVGSESGPRRRPANLNWIRSIRDQCQAAGVPLFIKQAEIDSKLVKMPAIDGTVWSQYPEVSHAD